METTAYTTTPHYSFGPCEKCHGPEIACFPNHYNICGDCRQEQATATGNGGHPDWACN